MQVSESFHGRQRGFGGKQALSLEKRPEQVSQTLGMRGWGQAPRLPLQVRGTESSRVGQGERAEKQP